MIFVQNLTKVYANNPAIPVLKGVDLNIPTGQFVAIRGRSGSGKTTLLNILGALDHPTSGNVLVDGDDIHRMNNKQQADFRRMKIGFIFQLFHLIPQRTVLENVMLPLLPYKRSLEFELEGRARETLGWVGLDQQTTSYPNYLSGGEQQRVAIARALVNRPKVILADEPTGNLDPETGSEVIQLLERFNHEQGITIVMVTHNQDISRHAQRCLVLDNGKINEVG